MPTNTEGEWIVHTCTYCDHPTRYKRSEVALFVLDYPNPYCTKCRYYYGRDFGYTKDGKLALTHEECLAIEAATRRHGYGRRPPIQYRSQADEDHVPTTPEPVDDDPKNWPRSWTPRPPQSGDTEDY